MGDQKFNNLTHQANKQDKPFYQLGLEEEESQAQPVPSQSQELPQPQDIGDSRQLERLGQQDRELTESVNSLVGTVEQTTIKIQQLESQLGEHRRLLRELQQQLAYKQREQQHHRETMALAWEQQPTDRGQYSVSEPVDSHSSNCSRALAPGRELTRSQARDRASGGYAGDSASSTLQRTRERGATQARIAPLPEDYQPEAWCYQQLLQHHGIPRDYAQKQLADFKMYWLDTGEARKAWGSRFVKHVIFQWQRERAQGQDEQRTARSQPTTQELTDRSWADRYDFDFD